MNKFVRLICIVFIILTFVGCTEVEQETTNSPTIQPQVDEGLTVDEFVNEVVNTPIPTEIITPTIEPTEVPEPTDVIKTDKDNKLVIVYITESGSKYHRSGCSSLSKSKIEINLEDAKKSYEPCKKCNPPE